VDPGDLLRAVRRSRRISQRELAEVVGVGPSTIDRIESGFSKRPSLALIERIMTATGYQLAAIDNHGRLLRLEEARLLPWDRGRRVYPAHLEIREVRTMDDPWWGWHCVAFHDRDPNRVDWTFDRGHRKYPEDLDRRWDAAT
jgi:transcriptional regulator with XRE-family HTH domain